MEVRARQIQVPYGVGRFSPATLVLVALLLAVIARGLYALYVQLTEGLVVTGLRDVGTMGGSTWGLYIAFDVYFVGVSFAGISTAALVRLLNLQHLRAVSRMAEVLTIVSLVLAAFSVLPDLGQPLRGIVHLLKYARPQSPFFGTFTMVIAGYLFASLVYFFLDGRRDAALLARIPGRLQWFYRLWAAGYRGTPAERERHHRVSFWLSLAILPMLVIAHSTLGFVFGLQVGRPGWFSALQAPAFVILAGVSGVGLLIVVAAVARRTLGAQDRLTPDVFRWLGNFLMVLTAAYMYFMLVDWLTATYAAPSHEQRVSRAIFVGPYARVYWVSVASLLAAFYLLLRQFLSGQSRIAVPVVSGVLVNIAAVGKRFLIVVPSQTHGAMLPYPPGVYAPSWVEYSILGGLVALGALMYVLFAKTFPLIDLPDDFRVEGVRRR
ncbi:MAG: NrfD/PsrC family molybdoenzyme membrane anchor subunit [Armatimonadota bacterium]|nr:NrfD/PsrC family molybdoenzyme membrane anchor subunit [Armatimonadota bacterium]MDR7437875.1 NrfD/PsrC family molybdoenzyme membrane anchor subunit [Armatimonadota bacterium]MDR7473311.1 NrfD/PsrC family molybdoenzyme membrane anchor subunit [Armatimonadota bacterium]MDR7507651.1 NrfD/PsrC family molybdoenzyme membrane anchor subunit [Armatimonadota bacterium]MDR7510005.1 NrfD/PsrC family molybdoenzyme membrane anchor subunit [Armatimonadota bacterium]